MKLSGRMLAAVYYGRGDIRVEEKPVPEIGRGEALVRVRASGICGSDVMHWYRQGRGPVVLGHEIAGEIAVIGEAVETLRVGERISVSHHVPCYTCRYCLRGHHTVCDTLRRTNFDPGGFSEFVRLPAINVERGVYRLPEGLSFEEATFIEPLACVYRGQRLAGMRIGLSVLVIGSGISGILHIKLARALGASSVTATDLNSYRRDAARRAGAENIILPGEDLPRAYKETNGGRGADLVILTTGAESAVAQAFGSVDRGGTILCFAPSPESAKIVLPFNELFWRNEITLTSSYAANYSEHMTALELIRSGKVTVSDMITHRLPLSDTAEGFRLVEEAADSLKVIIEP